MLLAFFLTSCSSHSTLIQAVAYSPVCLRAGEWKRQITRKITLEEVIDFARKNYPAIQVAKAETKSG